MRTNFNGRQRHIFWGCFLGYLAAYVARLNISAALPGLMGSMRLTDAQGGMFQTVFALVYATGQLVNGAIVDRVSARIHIFLGLLFSAACNLLFGLAQTYWLLIALWALNGAAQSMLWTPIVKLLAAWFHGRLRARASFGLSICLIAGNILAWALSGILATMFSWRLSFLFPAAIAAAAGFVCLSLLQDNPDEGEFLGEEIPAHPQILHNPTVSIGYILRKTGLWAVLLCCVCNGFVRDGITTWAPTIVADLVGGLAAESTVVSLIIPTLNILGILLARYCFHIFKDDARVCTGCLMTLSAILALALLPAQTSGIVCTLLLGLCCASVYGLNPMLTSMVPMEYAPVGHVALVAGIVDCAIYLGSSLAGVGIGAVSDASGWSAVFVLWSVTAAAGLVFAFLSLRGKKMLNV